MVLKAKAAKAKASKSTKARKPATTRPPIKASKPGPSANAAKAAAPPETAEETQKINLILAEIKPYVLRGMEPKLPANAAVEAGLRAIMRPKILRKLRAKGDWDTDKVNVLTVAEHMGQICKILAAGTTVDLSVAEAALVAAKADERCVGGAGQGDWCL